jgi:AcrR family transcriptional regulator
MTGNDRRTKKTKAAIYQAMSELIQERRYENITIQEIIDRANVGRTTFYSHFTDKEDLLSRYIETIFESFHEHLFGQNQFGHGIYFTSIAELFTHIQENRKLIAGILGSDSGVQFHQKFKKYWYEKVRNYLLELIEPAKQPEIPMDILTNYITGTLAELIEWWMQAGAKYSPKQMEQYYIALISPTIDNYI